MLIGCMHSTAACIFLFGCMLSTAACIFLLARLVKAGIVCVPAGLGRQEDNKKKNARRKRRREEKGGEEGSSSWVLFIVFLGFFKGGEASGLGAPSLPTNASHCGR